MLVTDTLDESQSYDVIIVTLLAHQVDAVLPALERSAVKQRREFSTSIEIQRHGNFRRSNGRKGFCESLWKRPALTTGKLTTLFDR